MGEVVAVSTTGIYCRSGCAAPTPRPGNAAIMPSAAAAEEAGYRACLRCRPYRTSGVDVAGAPETVCRAVRLILAGALDGSNEEALGRALGLSGRHLRRLFVDHLGVTPSGLAISARAHFARRLLDDTDLTFTEIAFAVGFGSVRQFNRVMRDVFRQSPQELRARRRRNDRLIADGGLVVRVPIASSFDWSGAMSLLAQSAAPGVEDVSDAAYRRVVGIYGDVGVVEVLAPREIGNLLVRLHLPHWGGLFHIVEQVRHVLGIDGNAESATRYFEDDPLIGPLVRKRPGLRPVGEWSSYEAGVKAIMGAPVDPAASKRLDALVAAAPSSHVSGLSQLGLSRRFPTPRAVADIDLEPVPIGRPRRRALVALSHAMVEGSVTLDPDQSLAHRVRSFRSLEGVTDSMAERFALLIGDPTAFPVGARIHRAIGHQEGEMGARSAVEDLLHRWRPFAAIAHAHLSVSV